MKTLKFISTIIVLILTMLTSSIWIVKYGNLSPSSTPLSALLLGMEIIALATIFILLINNIKKH